MPTLLALPFPAFNPTLWEYGPFAIRWYALAYIAGLVIGWWLAIRLCERPRLFEPRTPPSRSDVDDMLLWAAIGIVLGGRLGFVLFYDLDNYVAHPLDIPQIWKGGMSFHGGAAGMAIATWLYTRARKISFLTLMDVLISVAPIGLFFGRLGNFINGELYGRVSDVPWAVLFPRGGYLPRHPSQLYEAGLEGILLFTLLMVLVARFRAFATPGLISGVFLAGYGVARFIVEFFREPDAQLGYLIGGLTMGQLLSAPMILAGIGVIVWARRRVALA